MTLLMPQAEAAIPAPRAAEGMPAEQDLLQAVRDLVPPLTRERPLDGGCWRCITSRHTAGSLHRYGMAIVT
jgi:hypothetical protein